LSRISACSVATVTVRDQTELINYEAVSIKYYVCILALVIWHANSADRGELIQIAGPVNVAYVYVFLGSIICRLYKLTPSDQAQVTLQVKVSLSDLV